MLNESKIPDLVLSYAKRLAKDGHRILRWITEDDVKRLRDKALEAIREYKMANADLRMYDKEQEEAREWLASLGVDFNEKTESCQSQ